MVYILLILFLVVGYALLGWIFSGLIGRLTNPKDPSKNPESRSRHKGKRDKLDPSEREMLQSFVTENVTYALERNHLCNRYAPPHLLDLKSDALEVLEVPVAYMKVVNRETGGLDNPHALERLMSRRLARLDLTWLYAHVSTLTKDEVTDFVTGFRSKKRRRFMLNFHKNWHIFKEVYDR